MPVNTPDILSIQQSDHDTLIRLETKLEILLSETRENNSKVSGMFQDHETRLRDIEAVHERVDPLKTVKTLESLVAWRSSIMSNWKLMLGLSSFISGAVGFIAAWLAVVYHILHLNK